MKTISFDGSGISHILYVTGNDLGYRFGSNESFSSEQRITSYNIGSENGSLTSPDLAVTPDGTVHITYSDSHASADDYSNKDIMYGRKNPGEPFITNLVFRGYRDYSSSGSWGAKLL